MFYDFVLGNLNQVIENMLGMIRFFIRCPQLKTIGKSNEMLTKCQHDVKNFGD